MKVYQYGVGKKIPDRLPEDVFTQFRLQNNFWNALVETENEFQARYSELLSDSDAELADLEEKMAAELARQSELRETVRRKRQQARKNVDVSLLKKEISACSTRLKEMRGLRKEVRARVKEEIRPRIRELDAERKARVKELRQEFASAGLYWCNYNAVCDSYNRSRQGIFRLRSQGRPARMKLHRFTGEGRLTVQLQGGLRPADLFAAKSGQLQIDPVPDAAWNHPRRGERKRLRKTTARIRVGSEGKQPVWFEFPLTLHRPIPDTGRIKTAQLKRQKIGNGWRWRLNITVDEPAPDALPLPHSTLALDIGWRKKQSGLRVAAYMDTDGNMGEVELDESYLRVNDRLVGLQSTIDSRFNDIRERLRGFLDATDCPQWLTEDTARLSSWRAPMRLVRTVNTWEANRFDADAEIFPELVFWRDKYLHLYDWLCNLRDKMQARRREEFRVFAKKAAHGYSRIILEDFDMGRTARRKADEDGADHASAARHYHKLAAPGELRAEMERAAAATGAEVVRAEAKNTTRTCPNCGGLVEADFARDIHVACDHCGFTYDQDLGAAEHLLYGSRNPGREEMVSGA